MTAAATLLKIVERRSKLLGLDAPTRVDATVYEVTQADLELQETLREARAKLAAENALVEAALAVPIGTESADPERSVSQ